jgi:hypothetical protein
MMKGAHDPTHAAVKQPRAAFEHGAKRAFLPACDITRGARTGASMCVADHHRQSGAQ